MSASDIRPQQEPRSSTTGMRLISFSSMIRQHSSSDISGVTVTIGLLRQSAAVSSTGLSPLATMRQTMSRSVTTPIGTLLERLSITGISPQSFSIIILATCGKGVSAAQHAGSLVMTSLTCIVLTSNTETEILGGENICHTILRSPFLGVSASETIQPPDVQPLPAAPVPLTDVSRRAQSLVPSRSASARKLLDSSRLRDSRAPRL